MLVTADAALIDQIVRFFGPAPPPRLGVAVSGGSDSLALLHLLHTWGRADLAVVTVNHGLRKAAASEALHVARICEGLGLPHDVLDWQGWDGRGNLQDQARRGRYGLIADWARDNGLDAVALGHTRDDQAETVLMRLARAAGVDGLAGIPARTERHGVQFLRPLLTVGRAALRDSLTRRKLRWVEDPSNEDEDFDRVRMRGLLARLVPEGIDAVALAQVAANMADARAALDRAAADWAAGGAKVVRGDVVFDRAALLAQPVEIARRCLAAALNWVSGAEYAPRGPALTDLIGRIRAPENATLHGCAIMSSGMTVRIAREHAAVSDARCPSDAVWDGRWRLTGPHAPDLELRALGEAVTRCPDWRATGLPRASLLASPAIWRGETLIAAPLAGLSEGWEARVIPPKGVLSQLAVH